MLTLSRVISTSPGGPFLNPIEPSNAPAENSNPKYADKTLGNSDAILVVYIISACDDN